MTKEKRLTILNFKANDSEVEAIRKKMESIGTANMSAYLRAMALNGYIMRLDLPQIREMIRLLSNMTNNLNQIAKRVNAHGQIYETETSKSVSTSTSKHPSTTASSPASSASCRI